MVIFTVDGEIRLHGLRFGGIHYGLKSSQKTIVRISHELCNTIVNVDCKFTRLSFVRVVFGTRVHETTVWPRDGPTNRENNLYDKNTESCARTRDQYNRRDREPPTAVYDAVQGRGRRWNFFSTPVTRSIFY